MLTPFKNNYGFGLVIINAAGRTRYGHNGGINGFNSFLAYFPESRVTVVVLANVMAPRPTISVAGCRHSHTVKLSFSKLIGSKSTCHRESGRLFRLWRSGGPPARGDREARGGGQRDPREGSCGVGESGGLALHARNAVPIRFGAGLRKPTSPQRLGFDYAGTIEAMGRSVTQFSVGEAVFGGSRGSLGEYVTVPADKAAVRKPERLTFEQAAGVTVAGVTALQAMRNKAQVQRGQRVLVNGAAGGVGTFAVQIAKVFGAEVTGVQSTRNMELVRSLGADHVIDYTKDDFTTTGERYDVVLDNVGNRSLSDIRRVLKPGAPTCRTAAAILRTARRWAGWCSCS